MVCAAAAADTDTDTASSSAIAAAATAVVIGGAPVASCVPTACHATCSGRSGYAAHAIRDG